MRAPWFRAAILGALVVLALAPPARAQTAGISYIYDRLGRLVGVVDPATNEAAIFRYDAVGNLLSIARQSAAVVAIIEFTPSSGSVGTAVTISGTGFGPTAADNTVTFNGSVATVVSASPTRLVATVPAGATTGPITVAAPGGSATSDRPFTVGTPGAPTITSFTPTIGTPATPVTITGTNFDVPANDRVVFNTDVRLASVNSAVSTAIQTAVPSNVGSGRISVATPAGQALSAQDFFVPPSPYTAADVALATRISIGDVTTVTLSTAGKIGLLVFDGTAGQRVSLAITNSTLGGFDVYVHRPDGVSVMSGLFTTAGGVLDVPALPTTGTYTIFVQPLSTYTGSFTLTLSAELTGTIVSDGPALPVTLRPGQNARLTFAGMAGQRASLAMTGATLGSVFISVLKPDGSTLMAPTVKVFSGGNAVQDLPLLPVTGTYTLFLDPYFLNSGAVTLLLSSEIVGPIALDGAAFALSVTRAAQNARLSFAGAAGQRVSLALTGVTIPCCFTVSILKPDGTTLVASSFGTGGGVLDSPVLPTTGSYALFVDPSGVTTGNATLTLSSEQTGTLVIDGASASLSLTRPGQNARLTFDGTAGQRVSLGLTGVTIPCCFATSILKPDGTTLVSSYFGPPGGTLDLPVLPASGSYTIFVDLTGLTTGNATLTLSSEQTGTLAIDGVSLPLSLTRPGQNARLTFDGTAGQRVSLALTGATLTSVSISVLKPDGSTLLSPTSPLFSGGNAVLDLPVPPVTGTYTLFVDPYLLNTGGLTLLLSSEIVGSIALDGATFPLSVTRAGQNARLTFDGTAGQRVSLALTGVAMGTGCCPAAAYILKPDGTTLTWSYFGVSGWVIDAPALPVSGTYAVFVDPQGINTGNATLTLSSELTGTLVTNGSGLTLTNRMGQNVRLTFDGTAGQQVTVRVTGNSMGFVTVRLLRPDNTSMTSTGSSSASFNLTAQTLATSGTYAVTVDPSSFNTGSSTVAVTSP
jgi:YD repeat-containing protein